MSETTKRILGADMIDLSAPWARRIDRTHLAARPVDQQVLRASTLSAEGGAELETTNSPAEIGTGCTGRKWVAVKMLVCAAAILFILASIWAQSGFWIAFDAASLCVWVGLFRTVWRRASGGGIR